MSDPEHAEQVEITFPAVITVDTVHGRVDVSAPPLRETKPHRRLGAFALERMAFANDLEIRVSQPETKSIGERGAHDRRLPGYAAFATSVLGS
jgi:hypothetical protein